MKKYALFMIAAVLAAAMGVCLAACGSAEMSMNINDEKSMTITAENSAAGDFVMAGTITVAEGEQIVFEPDLDEGVIEIGFISSEGTDDIDEIPDTEDAEAQFSIEVSDTQQQVAAVPEGTYMVKAVVKEKANGIVEATVQ